MGTQVASLYGVLSLDDKDFIKGLGIAKSGVLDLEGDLKTMGGGLTESVKRIGDKITEIGGKLTVMGETINAILGPLMDFGMAGVDAAVDFEAAMKNAQAAAGYTNDEIAVISEQVMAIGVASRYGPQEAALAFYEIAGGVSDASTRMAIFEASVSAAQAGNADLAATTKSMIGIMNAYGLGAEDASFASDVLTRVVGTGVGSMDEFGMALAAAAKFAPGLDIGLEDLGSSMAYLTTKNIPAAQSATLMTSMMTTLLSPTKDIADAIHEAGYESGEAMIKAEGLVGAYEILKANNDGTLSGLITNTEALAGATILATEEFQKFDDAFKGSAIVASDGPKGLVDNMDLVSGAIQGATADAEAIQMSSTAAQFDLLTSSVDGLKIAVGDNLIPVLVDLTNNVLKPIVQGVTDWAQQNPQLTTGLFIIVGALTLFSFVLNTVGGLMTAFGVATTILAPVMTWLAAGITWASGAAIPLAGGLTWAGAAAWLASTGMTAAGAAVGLLTGALGLLVSPIAVAILAAAALAWAYYNNFGGIKDFIDGTVRPALDSFFALLRDAWSTIQPELEKLKNWFDTAMVNIAKAVKDVEGGVSLLIGLLGGIWNDVKGGVEAFAKGIEDTLGPVIEFIGGIATAVNDVILALGGIPTTYTATAGTSNPGGYAAGAAAITGAMDGNAEGGPVYAGVPSMVGEQGREIFIPSSNGTIVPNGETEGMMGGMTISIGAIYANDAAGGRAAGDAFGTALKEKMASRG